MRVVRDGKVFYKFFQRLVTNIRGSWKEIAHVVSPWDSKVAIALSRFHSKSTLLGRGLENINRNSASHSGKCTLFSRRHFSSMRCRPQTSLFQSTVVTKKVNFWKHNSVFLRRFCNISPIKRAGITSLVERSRSICKTDSTHGRYIAGYGRFICPFSSTNRPSKILEHLWQCQKRSFTTSTENVNGYWSSIPTFNFPGFRATEVPATSLASLPPLGEPSYESPHVDFEISPQFTISENSDLTEDAVETLESDLSRYMKQLEGVISDIKKVSKLGELPLSVDSSRGTVRVYFPNCDTEKVHRLVSDVEVARGVVRDGYGHSDLNDCMYETSSSSMYSENDSWEASSDYGIQSFDSDDIPTPSLTRDTGSHTHPSSDSAIVLNGVH